MAEPLAAPAAGRRRRNQSVMTRITDLRLQEEFFPIDIFEKCPGLACIVPEQWRKIQDMTHLIVMIGLICCIVLAGLSLSNLSYCSAETEWICSRETTSGVYAVILFLYILRVSLQFDDRLQVKEEKAQLAKRDLLKSYRGLIADMDANLSAAAESAAALAEHSFDSKRRDFQRFLDVAKVRFETSEPRMLSEFREYVALWLVVFRECSIDPVNRPKDVVKAKDLKDCRTIADISGLVYDCLEDEEVKFITNQRKRDEDLFKYNQKRAKTMARVGPSSTSDDLGELEAAAKAPDADLEANRKRVRGMTWLGCACGCSVKRQGREFFPRDIRLPCFRVTVLSFQHLALILAFCTGWASFMLSLNRLLLNIASQLENSENDSLPLLIVNITLLFMCQICLTMLLNRFEDIDLVQKLQRELDSLKTLKENLEEESKASMEFWDKTKNLTELWLYRTVPRLDLHKELQSQFEELEDRQLLMHLTDVNETLDDLENTLGRLEEWLSNGSLDLEDKKKFGKAMSRLCQITDPGALIQRLSDTINPSGQKGVIV